MLSRRNIRVKVLQTLYACIKNEDLQVKSAIDRFDKAVQNTFEIYVYNLQLLADITQYAKEEEDKRKNKFIVNPEDLTFSAKLATNPCTESLITNPSLKALVKFYKIEEKINADLCKKIYFDFSKEEVYKEYVYNQEGNQAHIDILLALYKFSLKDDHCNEIIEDFYAAWEDDKSLVMGAVKKTLKDLPLAGDFHEKHKPDPEAVDELGKKLLKTYVEHEKSFENQIASNLVNWEVDRVAQIDMLLIKLAMAEFLYIDIVPTHVTLNEYIELAKLYSHEKSAEFLNGILDKLCKQLKEAGKITKE